MRSTTSHHLLGTPVALLLAAVTAVGCQSSSPHPARAHDPTPSQPTYFAQYGVSTHAYKPRRLNPSVDGSLVLRGLTWTACNAREATGTGVAHFNDCKPNCAAGTYTTHRVSVRLAHPRKLCGSRFFTSFRVRGSGYHTYARWSGVVCR